MEISFCSGLGFTSGLVRAPSPAKKGMPIAKITTALQTRSFQEESR